VKGRVSWSAVDTKAITLNFESHCATIVTIKEYVSRRTGSLLEAPRGTFSHAELALERAVRCAEESSGVAGPSKTKNLYRSSTETPTRATTLNNPSHPCTGMAFKNFCFERTGIK
jgi:hypothetical protein